MTEFTSLETGVTRDVELDPDAVMDYERSHPGQTLKHVMDGVLELRFCDMDTIARFLGFDGLKDFMACGFDLEDMAEMVAQSRLMGFTNSARKKD